MRRSQAATMTACAALALALAGCSGIQELQNTSTGPGGTESPAGTTATSPQLQAVTPLTPTAPSWLRGAGAKPGVGATQSVMTRGAHLQVTLQRVIDPLLGAGVALPTGARAVAVLVRITSSGPSLYDSSATGDFSLGVSAGVVTPLLATRGVCRTPLNDFDRYITAGEVRSGCVAFAVPKQAVVTAVRFSPHAQAAGRLSWSP
jgi:hypothetical protein